MLRRKQGAERQSIRKEVGSLRITRSKKPSFNKWHLNTGPPSQGYGFSSGHVWM